MKPRPVAILLVQSDAADADRVRQLLHRSPLAFELVHAHSLAEAAERLASDRTDVIVLDLPLPDRGALDALKRLRGGAGETPIVIVAAADDPELSAGARYNGAWDYMVKATMDGPALVRCLRGAVEHGRAQTMERQRDSLRRSMRGMADVLGVVGHELRTPLAALRATTEYLISDGAKESAEWDVFLHSIHHETIRLAELVNNLLEVARMNSGQAQWRWSSVKLAVTCDDALNVVRPLVDHARVVLGYDVQPPNLTMKGDAEAIQRMIINFTSNSAKHTTDGSIHLNVRDLVLRGARWIELCVRDTGQGIPDAVVKKLGKAFVLNSGVVGSDYVKGAGLGLAICKQIVAVHGGSVRVESTPGQGAAFIIRLRADLDGPVRGAAQFKIVRDAAA